MKKIILTVIATFSALWAFSQDDSGSLKQQNRHEFSLGGSGGISSLKYKPSIGDNYMEPGWLAGIGYAYYFNYNWGISTGVEYQPLKGKYTLDHSAVGSEMDFLDEYIIDSRAPFDRLIVSPRKKLTEKQQAAYVNIPVSARYEFDFPWETNLKVTKFSMGAGLKFGIPIGDAKYQYDGILETKGAVINQQDGTRDLLSDMPNHGFSTYAAYNGKFGTNLNVVGMIEAGLKWQFNPHCGLYTGLFADFGLSDVVKKGNIRDDVRNARNYLDYNYANPSSPAVNTIFLSNYGYVEEVNGGIEREQRFVNRVNSLAFGLKIAITFGSKPVSKKVKVKQQLVAAPEDPWDKPITGYQMRQLLKEQTGNLTDTQREELEKLKKFLRDELKEPDLSTPVYCFDFDKENIPADMRAILDHKVHLLKEYPSVSLILEGHTDHEGSDKYNYELGLRRAEAVKYYLVSKGISSTRLSVISKGKSQPIVTKAENEKANCPNRRVEFIIRK